MDFNSINSINKNNITLTVNFSLEQIKQAVTELVAKKPMLYQLEKDHCTENTYRMDVYNGINPATMTLSVHQAEENMTVITAVVQNANGGHASDVLLADVLKDFLIHLQKALKGDYKKKKGGCLGKAAMITTVIIATVSLIFIM